MNEVLWDASGTVDVKISGQYATILVNPALVAGTTVAGDPGMFLGNSNASFGNSLAFLRRVCIEGLNIASNKDPLAGASSKIGRRGVLFKGIQELRQGLSTTITGPYYLHYQQWRLLGKLQTRFDSMGCTSGSHR